jgi:hypothetical protein
MKSTVLFASLFLIGTNVFSQVSAPSVETAFQNYIRAESGNVYSGSALPTFLIKEDTKGNRYLFEKWVSGSVTGTDGVLYNSSKFLFNYDKVGRKLFMWVDSTTVMELSSKDIAGFNLKEDNLEYNFERLKNSTDLNFYQPVYKDEKGFSLFKLLLTKFVRADYQTNGITESGNKYDEYVDDEQYFILSSKGELMKIELKKKSIEKVLENKSSEVESFFNDHKKDKVDEAFVKNLLQSLNSKS